MVPRRGEAIGQTTEIVIIVQVFWSGASCGPHVAILGLEVLGLRRRYQSEIVFGVLKIVLRGDLESRSRRRALVVSAEKELVFRCGQASITLTRAGKVLLRGTYPSSRSSGANRIKGGSVQINLTP